MPELPDVEIQRRRLAAGGLKRPIAHTHVPDDRVLDGVSARKLAVSLKGRRLLRTRRHGKHLLVAVDGDDPLWLTLHFGMTGELVLDDGRGEPPRYARVILEWRDGGRLCYLSRRLLGHVGLAGDPEAFARAHDLGPDVLDLGRRRFLKLLADRRGMVKSALMDQSLLAGVGNVYADEILYQAGIHPRADLDDLDDDDRKRLRRVMRRVLRTAIDRKADPERLPRRWLLPRREEGAACPRCGGRVRRLEVGGRATYVCPACQGGG